MPRKEKRNHKETALLVWRISLATTMAFAQLPDELLLHIFSYFSQSELYYQLSHVCQAWKSLAHDASFWRTATINNRTRFVQDVPYRFILESMPTLRDLHIDWNSRTSFEGSNPVLHQPELKQLTLHCLPWIPKTIYDLMLAQFSSLEDLTIYGRPSLNLDKFLLVLSLPGLKRLSFPNMTNLPTDGFMVIAFIGPPLASLDVSSQALTDQGLMWLASRQHRSLKCLHLNANKLSQEGFIALSHFNQLRTLNVRRTVSSPLLKVPPRMFDTFSQLRVLHLGKGIEVVNTTLLTLAPSCPQVITIQMDQSTQVTDEGVMALVHGCPSLRYVSMGSQFLDLRTENVEAVLASDAQISPYPFRVLIQKYQRDIVDLHLTWTGSQPRYAFVLDNTLYFPSLRLFRFVTQVGLTTDESQTCANRCPALTILHIESACDLDEGILPLITHPQLHSMTLSYDSLTNEDVQKIAQACRQLTSLHLVMTHVSYLGLASLCETRRDTLTSLTLCKGVITYGSVQTLATCPHLTKLCLVSCTIIPLYHVFRYLSLTTLILVNMGVMKNIIFTQPQLTHLELVDMNISDVTLKKIAAKCPHLVFLNLGKCPYVTNYGLYPILHHCKQLTHLYLSSSSRRVTHDFLKRYLPKQLFYHIHLKDGSWKNVPEDD